MKNIIRMGGWLQSFNIDTLTHEVILVGNLLLKVIALLPFCRLLMLKLFSMKDPKWCQVALNNSLVREKIFYEQKNHI